MDEATRDKLDAINRDFYRTHARAFSRTRSAPWPGWKRVLAALPRDAAPLRVLDAGCGNGRFALFLADARTADGGADHAGALAYTGVDASDALLELARARIPARLAPRLLCADLIRAGGRGLPEGAYHAVVAFGFLHHVPGASTRRALLRALASRVAPGGLLALSWWDFEARPDFARRRVPWSARPEIEPGQLEPGDALLRWGSGADPPLRYCHRIEPGERQALLATSGLEPREAYSDAGGTNHYDLLVRPPSGRQRDSV